ncbi:hypothetical protein [Capnocytophaga sp. G2]|uniref:hypothetical protein n=1 Tax=Capnocytophaga sp. G2 TaxID=3110695 RepID=UPI002B46C5D9|nr:hypothetical protein [Capnocytophaga sp. G2]MEB3005597.1 hypothetical protein [Capnocytophaga sp. G2]
MKNQPSESETEKDITSLNELKMPLADYLSFGYQLNEVQCLELRNEWNELDSREVELTVVYTHKDGVYKGYSLCLALYDPETKQTQLFYPSAFETDEFIKNLQRMQAVVNKLNRLKPTQEQDKF